MGRGIGIKNIERPDFDVFKKDCDTMRLKDVCLKYNCKLRTVSRWRKEFGLAIGKKVDRPISYIIKNNCWICVSHKINKNGYPEGNRKRGRFSIARVMYERKYGKVPKYLCILHKCDNRKCINPDHLFLGDRSVNNKDAVSKNRNCYGTKHHLHKLDREKILFAREERGKGLPYHKIAKYLGVSYATLWLALNGKTWKQTMAEDD